jgi:hypothetical protein
LADTQTSNRDALPDPYVPRSRESGRGNVMLATVFIALLAIFIIADFLLYPYFLVPLARSVVLDSKFHHLGDNDYSEAYISQIPGDKIRNLNSEGLIYTTRFDMVAIKNDAGVSEDATVKKAEISMNVNHLKERRSAPVRLGLNGGLVAYLNDYVTREEFRRTPINILLDVPLSQGGNELVIVAGKDTEENAGPADAYEDFEFDNLLLHIEFNATHLPFISWFSLIVLVEGIILLVVLSFLVRST